MGTKGKRPPATCASLSIDRVDLHGSAQVVKTNQFLTGIVISPGFAIDREALASSITSRFRRRSRKAASSAKRPLTVARAPQSWPPARTPAGDRAEMSVPGAGPAWPPPRSAPRARGLSDGWSSGLGLPIPAGNGQRRFRCRPEPQRNRIPGREWGRFRGRQAERRNCQGRITSDGRHVNARQCASLPLPRQDHYQVRFAALNCLPPPGTPGAGIPQRPIHRCRRSDV